MKVKEICTLNVQNRHFKNFEDQNGTNLKI